MPSKIRLLPIQVINRIAAGEVAERPSSIVRELIDNSIDAGSSRIRVALRDGGKSLISVADNGEGMDPEDARMAFERHATSKLYSEEDLESIRSLGFRGEALPSIAAVSRVTLATQPRSGPGTLIEIGGGKVLLQSECARAVGTELNITELFDNFPVRKKFLRSVSTELNQTVSVFNQTALARPGVQFELIHQTRSVLHYPAVGTLRERFLQIYGQEILDQMIPADTDPDPMMSVGGLVTLPPYSLGTRSIQEIFVNGRPIRNSLIAHAVYEAYASHLMKDRHPGFVLFIRIDPARVDVNVHPSKKEVRFSDSASVHGFVRHAVREAIGQQDVRQGVRGPSEAVSWGGVAETSGEYRIAGDRREPYRDAGQESLWKNAPPVSGPEVKVLGQCQSMFLLLQVANALHIIDQHAAHERVIYEKIVSRTESEILEPRPLLIPMTIELGAGEIGLLKENEKAFGEIGIEYELFGESTLLLRTLPALVAERSARELIRELLREIETFGELSTGRERQEKFAATLACHSAVRAGDVLETSEITALFSSLSRLKPPLTCPHGRPISRQFSLQDLEKMFCRT